MWDFRHGKKTIAARIEDDRWLQAFQSRKEDVRPGDAIECSVRIEAKYGHDNELLSEGYFVTDVHRVLPDDLHKQIEIQDES